MFVGGVPGCVQYDGTTGGYNMRGGGVRGKEEVLGCRGVGREAGRGGSLR